MTHLAFELRTDTPEPVAVTIAQRAEARGYRSLWVDHPPGADGIGQLARMGAATSRITLGTGVVPISAVPPGDILRRIEETGELATPPSPPSEPSPGLAWHISHARHLPAPAAVPGGSWCASPAG